MRGSLLSGLRRRRTKMNKGFLKKEGDLEGTFWRRIENQLSLIRRKGRHTEELPKTFYWTIVLQMSFCCKKNMFWRFLCHGNPLRHQNRKSDPLRHHSRKKSKLIRGARRGMTLSFQFHRFTRFTLCASLSAAATLRCLSTNSYFCCVYYTGTYLV